MTGAADILATIALVVGGLWLAWRGARIAYNLFLMAMVLVGSIGRHLLMFAFAATGCAVVAPAAMDGSLSWSVGFVFATMVAITLFLARTSEWIERLTKEREAAAFRAGRDRREAELAAERGLTN